MGKALGVGHQVSNANCRRYGELKKQPFQLSAKFASLHIFDIPGGILQRRGAVGAISPDKWKEGDVHKYINNSTRYEKENNSSSFRRVSVFVKIAPGKKGRSWFFALSPFIGFARRIGQGTGSKDPLSFYWFNWIINAHSAWYMVHGISVHSKITESNINLKNKSKKGARGMADALF
jgi:hypothetical protein